MWHDTLKLVDVASLDNLNYQYCMRTCGNEQTHDAMKADRSPAFHLYANMDYVYVQLHIRIQMIDKL